ncbi:MAG: DEAD/DEAH box helicase, partial [Thermodesulfobacteriota bacterium]
MVRKVPRKDELVITFFQGNRTLAVAHLTTTDGLRPFRGRIRSGSMETHIQPKELMERIKRAKQIILIPDKATKALGRDLEALFPWSSPIWGNPCKFCLLRGRVNFPKKRIRYGLEQICMDCAKAQFTKEAQSKGWRASEAMVKHLGRILENSGDYDTAWRTISPDYDPERDSHLSLYDVIDQRTTKHRKIEIDEIVGLYEKPQIAEPFVRRLKDSGIETLLPVQATAIEKGLLKGKNLLVVSSTSSGKTLIAEMAAIPRALEGRKFFYLTPLVALANLRYSEFTYKYRDLGLVTAIKVGVGRIRTGNELKLNTDFEHADIVVGTYEGIEQVLRSGGARRLGDVGLIAVDEIQNLADEDRGSRLDGLIKKLRVLYPKAQFLHLSATVGNPSEIASSLGTKLVAYDERPVPLERHIIPISSPGQKIRLMSKLINREFRSISTEGYHGQTLIFTNSRRKCHELASALSTRSAPVSPYHSGLSYERRRAIESQFVRQRIAAVATTAALAAGVDLPASQVIFESLAMGMEWISPAEFHQMLGRAGRLGYHGSGRAMLLIEPGRSFSRA